DLPQLDVLQHRERLARAALLRVAEGAAVGLHAPLDVAEELVFPVGQLDPRPFGRAPGLAQRAQRRAFRLLLAVRRLAVQALAGRTVAFWRLALQISPSADRYRSRIASSSCRLARSCLRRRTTLRRIFT